MTAPVITPLPPAPTRADAPSDFTAKADAFVAAQVGMVTEFNASAAFVDQRATDADASAAAAAASEQAVEADRLEVVTRADEVATNTNTVVARADEVAANTLQVAQDTQQVAEDAQAVADALASIADGPVASVNGKTGVVIIGAGDVLPPFSGNTRRALVVNSDESGVEWGDAGQKIGDVLITARTPDATYLPATGSIYMQSAYPDLFGMVGLIGESAGVSWNVTEVEAGTGNSYIAAAPDGTCIRVGTYPAISRDFGVTWEAGSVPANMTMIATDGSGTWIAATGTTTASVRYSNDNGITWGASSVLSGGGPTAIGHGNGVWVITMATSRPSRSTDGGATWTRNTTGATTTPSTALATDGRGVWIGIQDGAAQVSVDDGLTFNLISGIPLTGRTPVGIQTDGAGNWLIVGNQFTVRSVDDRVSWTLLSGSTQPAQGRFATDKSGTWIVAATTTSVWRSTDNGLSWSNISVTAPSSYATDSLSYAGGVFIGGARRTMVMRGLPSYGYDTATQFRVPNLPSAAGLMAYIKGSETQ